MAPEPAWIGGLAADDRARLRVTPVPDRFEPELATLTRERFSDPAWIYERKLDGQRCLAVRRDGTTRLRSRSGRALNATYPELVDALDAQSGGDFAVDGEVVAFEGNRTSFSRLQQRLGIQDERRARRSSVDVIYYLFDVVHRDGVDLASLPLRTRKALLLDLVRWEEPLRFTRHRNADGEAYWEEACRRGWEGLIAKHSARPYHGGRSPDWLKFKCSQGQEFVVGGYTKAKGSRTGLGALLLGYHERGALHYAGKVGTGFDTGMLRHLREVLDGVERPTSPFAEPVREADATWAEPTVVVQVEFTEWTDDGRLRHPRFTGLRHDKAPAEVVREVPR